MIVIYGSGRMLTRSATLTRAFETAGIFLNKYGSPATFYFSAMTGL
jgi:hypothetical protein